MRNPAFDVTPAELVHGAGHRDAASRAPVNADDAWPRLAMRVARSLGARTRRSSRRRPTPSPGPGEVVCRVLACAPAAPTCRRATSRRKLPAVLGHEPAGEVRRGRRGRRRRRGRRPRRDPPPRAVRRVPPLPPRARDAVRALPRHRPRPRRLRRARARPAPSWSASCCRSTASTRCSPPSSSRSPACCARSDRAGCAPATRCSSSAPGCSGLLHDRRRARARRRGRVGARAAARAARAALERWGAERHGNEPVDVAIVCTPRPDAIAAAAAARRARRRAAASTRRRRPAAPLGDRRPARCSSRELDVTAS